MDISLKKGANEDDVKEILQKKLGSNFKILNRYQQNTTLYKVMQSEKWAGEFVVGQHHHISHPCSRFERVEISTFDMIRWK